MGIKREFESLKNKDLKPQSLVQSFIHIVFSTKYRQPFIDSKVEEELFNDIHGICENHKCYVQAVGGYKDHVHILLRISSTVAICVLVKEIKESSSKWIKTKGDSYQNFYWQRGYAVFSVNYKGVSVVSKYIKNQKVHHQKKEFQKEYLKLLKEANMEYDERYMWD